MIGRVSLVGAGPGDIELLTIKAFNLLQNADVVLYDNLATEQIIQSLPPYTQAICVGKRPHLNNKPDISQNQINDMMITYAKAGKQVVRLKSGDPSVFAHGSEEVQALLQADVFVEVVPGISSFLASASCCNMSLTHRVYSSGFMVITGHEDPEKPHKLLNWPMIANNAKSGMTLVILMGIKTIERIASILIAEEVEASLPTMVVHKASQPEEKILRSTLATVSHDIIAHNMSAPSVIFIGKVVGEAQHFT